jgi:hypothetical protein
VKFHWRPGRQLVPDRPDDPAARINNFTRHEAHMGLDIYVGTLTRYYSGRWETIVARAARDQGVAFQTVRPDNPSDAVTDPSRIAPAVVSWRTSLSGALGDHVQAPLDWPEGMDAPYFTDKPDWDGFGGLVLWAAYLEQPGLQRPIAYRKDWENDAAFKAATAQDFQSKYMPTLTSELWLAGDPAIAFQAEDMSGKVVWMSFTAQLLNALGDLNARTWRAARADIVAWRGEGPPNETDSLERRARFGFAIFFTLASLAVEHRLPMKLDY